MPDGEEAVKYLAEAECERHRRTLAVQVQALKAAIKERPMPDAWTAEQSLLVSKWAYEAGQWRAQADAFARIIRSELRPTDYGGELPTEVALVLQRYDELAAEYDDAMDSTHESITARPDGYRSEDISVDESKWHGTPFTQSPQTGDARKILDNNEGSNDG